MTEQSGDVLRDWLRERGANARRLAALKTGQDRAGWLEDAAYFDAAALAVSRATPPTPEQAGPSGEALTEALREIEAITAERPAAGLDDPTEFAIAQDRGFMLSRIKRIANLALASPGAMEGAQAAQPEPFGYHYAAEGFRDAWSKRRLLGVVPMLGDVKETILYAHPPAGEPT